MPSSMPVQSLFLDLILGEVSSAGFWAIVDSFTGAIGNFITYM